MKKMVLGSCMAALVAGVAVADTVTSVNVVGYYNLTVAGDASAAVYTLLSVPMVRMPVDRGTISGNTDQAVTVSGAGWTASEFAPPADWQAGNEAQEETYFVEVTSGAFEGRMFYIADNTTDTLTLAAAVADLSDSDLIGATYKIVPSTRVQDILGAPGGEIALLGAASAASADNVLLWSASGWSSAVYYKNAGLGLKDHWMQGSTAVDDMPLGRDDGMMVKRQPGNGDAVLTVAGEVSGNLQAVVVDDGYTLQNGMVAVDTPIAESGLDTVLTGGTSAANADNILEWVPGSGWSQAVYYKNGGLGGTGWRQGSVDVGSTFILKAGQAYLFKVQTPLVWDRESPVQ
jgi:hypothetical protein